MKKLLIGLLSCTALTVTGMDGSYIEQVNAIEHLMSVARYERVGDALRPLKDSEYTKLAENIVFKQVKECALRISREPNAVERLGVDKLVQVLQLPNAQVRMVDAQSILGNQHDITGWLDDYQQLCADFQNIVEFDKECSAEFINKVNKLVLEGCSRYAVGRNIIAASVIRNNGYLNQLPFLYQAYLGDKWAYHARLNAEIGAAIQSMSTEELNDFVINKMRENESPTYISEILFESSFELGMERELLLVALLVNATSKNVRDVGIPEGFEPMSTNDLREFVSNFLQNESPYIDLLKGGVDLWNLHIISDAGKAVCEKYEGAQLFIREAFRKITRELLKTATGKEKVLDTLRVVNVRNLLEIFVRLIMRAEQEPDFATRAVQRFEKKEKLPVRNGEFSEYCYSSPALSIAFEQIPIRSLFSYKNSIQGEDNLYSFIHTDYSGIYHELGHAIDVLFGDQHFQYFSKTFAKVAHNFFKYEVEFSEPKKSSYEAFSKPELLSEVLFHEDNEFWQIIGGRLIEHNGEQILLINKMSDFALSVEQGEPIRHDHLSAEAEESNDTKFFMPDAYDPLMQIYGIDA